MKRLLIAVVASVIVATAAAVLAQLAYPPPLGPYFIQSNSGMVIYGDGQMVVPRPGGGLVTAPTRGPCSPFSEIQQRSYENQRLINERFGVPSPPLKWQSPCQRQCCLLSAAEFHRATSDNEPGGDRSENSLVANTAARAQPTGTEASSAALPRSWNGLRLGMTPVQFGQTCKKMGLGGPTNRRVFNSCWLAPGGPFGANEDDAQRYFAGMPLFQYCRFGCKGLEAFVYREISRRTPYGMFIGDHAILLSLTIMTLENLCENVLGEGQHPHGSRDWNLRRCSRTVVDVSVTLLKGLYGSPTVIGKSHSNEAHWYVWRDAHTQLNFIDDVVSRWTSRRFSGDSLVVAKGRSRCRTENPAREHGSPCRLNPYTAACYLLCEMETQLEGGFRTVSLVYKCEQTPGYRFRAKGEIIMRVRAKYVIQQLLDPDDSLTFDTLERAKGRTWRLALKWRDTESPSTDLTDENGRFPQGTA